MPRRNLPSRAPARRSGWPLRALGWARREAWDGGEWLIRTVPGAQTTKTYRCPGCEQEIGRGTSHVVVWPCGEHGSVQDRRHWHTACWSARARRATRGER